LPEPKRPIEIDDLYRITLIEDPRVSPDARWIAYVQVTIDKLDNEYKRNIWIVPTAGGKPAQLTRSGKDSTPRWSPDGKTLAFVSARDKKPQVYLLNVTAPGGEPRPLTGLPNGASAPAWSPDGTHIAFLAGSSAAERADEDRGEKAPPPADKLEAKQRAERKEHDETSRWDPRPIERIPYRSGTSYLDDRFAQVYVIPTAEGLPESEARPRRLTDVDASHEPPQWTADGQFLLTARTVDPLGDMPWRSSSLYRIRVSDGALEQLTDQSHTSYGPVPAPAGDLVAYTRLPQERLTERINRLTVTTVSGDTPRDLNLDFDRGVVDFRWARDGQALIFTAESWGGCGLYSVQADGGPVREMIAGDNIITAFDLAPDGSVAYAAASAANPSELFWRAADGQPVQLTEVNRALLDEVIVQEKHELRFQSPGGQELQGWYMLPVGYEPGETYPLALNIHGGPHVMWGPATQSIWHETQCHAARGYAVFYCNPRGADGYGEAFQAALHASWGDIAFADIMAGVDTLLEKGFVDPARMAVTGGSYGGYMTAWIVGHTDRFAAAVSQRGVYNLLSFYGTSDVPLLISNEYDTEPWENPQLLWQQSPLAYAHQIRTPLLILHSENDFRVPISDGEQLFAYIRRSGGTVKMIRFPREGHELSRSGEPAHRASRLTHMIAWFDRYCQPQTGANA
jgi:dipeptidyl aminopeptidase/acylaminoacyl peptidase